ncbi:hypothetical protein [Pygmaiobacter massiliensis]|uniref:hypothetical protein n=1 Tax=Pygmaiobacter massiliensis TaxID=1917873 RepID=UPI0028976152|nr:hypothetical protein [Pygmaiobacter massiliensis]
MMKLKLISCALAASIFLTGAALPDVPAVEESTPSSSAVESSSALCEPNSDLSSMPEEIADSSVPESAPEDVSEAPIEDSSVPTDASSSEAANEDAVSSEIADESEPTFDTTPVVQAENCITEDLAVLLSTNQADSMMGNLGLVRSGACAEIVASFTVADYNTENNQDANYAALWVDMNTAFHLAADTTAANCVYENGVITILR